MNDLCSTLSSLCARILLESSNLCSMAKIASLFDASDYTVACDEAGLLLTVLEAFK